MRDLYKTLQICETEEAMDYCTEFDDIKSELEHCNMHVKPFKKMVFRSGNELIINDLTRRLEELFVKYQLVDPTDKTPLPGADQKFRKILMFLFVNTDATYKYNLRNDPKYVHVVEICPLLPKFLTVALVWELQLDSFFYEALSYTPCWFAFQYFEAANDSIKYIDNANKELSVIEQLLRSLLINIEMSIKFKMDDVDQRIIFNKLYEQAAILLRRFNTPDSNKLEKMKKRFQKRYRGYQLKHLMDATLFAVDLYESKYESASNFDDTVYRIGKDFYKINQQTKECNLAAKGAELRITNTLLSTLQNCAVDIKMEDFIEWAEVDLTESLTLQQAVGELAYRVRERINASADFEHGVEDILKSVEIRPKPISMILKEATIGDILRTLDNSTEMPYEMKKLWFDELFNRGQETLGNDECRQAIASHIDLLTTTNCEKIIDCIQLSQNCKKFLTSDSNSSVDADREDSDFLNNEELIEFLLSSLKTLTNLALCDLLEYQNQIFGELHDGLSVDSEKFEQRATELLNKCTTNFDLSEFLLLCFENPLQIWRKFFNLACNAIEHLNVFIETLEFAQTPCFIYVDHILKETAANPKHSVYFPEMICELYFSLYRKERKRQNDFLANFLNCHLKSCLDAEDFNCLIPIVKALNLITQRNDENNFDELTVPMLAMVACVTEEARWKLNTFSNVRVELVGMCIDFIIKTLKKFLPFVNNKDRNWMSLKIRSTCIPLTEFYFQSILCPREENILPLEEFLCSNQNIEPCKTVKYLNKLLFRCTCYEYKCIASSARFSPYISEAMTQLTLFVNSDPTPNAILNLRYCLAEYRNFVNDILKPKCKSAKESCKLLYTLLKLIAILPSDIYGQVFMETESLLKDIFTNANKSLPDDEIKELKDYVSTMPDCTAKKVFQQTLNVSISSELNANSHELTSL